MKITLPSLFALSLAVGGLSLAGCTVKKVTEVKGASPAISSATPSVAFRGRTLDVHLAGSGTAWDATTKVAFGTGITVNKITVASTAAIVANITIANDATLGLHDISVTDGANSEPYSMAFTIDSAISTKITGTVAQGSIVFFTITNNAKDTPFDDTSSGDGLFSPKKFTNIVLSGTDGIEFQVSDVTPRKITGLALISTTAAAGALDIDVKSGPTDGTGTVDDSKQLAAGTIAARTPAALTDGTTATLTEAGASMIYSFTPKAVGDRLSFATSDTGGVSQIIVFSPTVAIKDVVASGASGASGGPAVYSATSTEPVYVLVYDGSLAGGVSASLTASDTTFAVQAGGEGNDTLNNTFTGAIAITTPPAKLSGASLSSVDDVDYYKIMVPAGKVIHVQTIPGDAKTDTVITFYGTDGQTMIGTETDKANHEDATSASLPGAGTYYFAISYSQNSQATPYAVGNSHYDLLVDLE